jgi:phosphatidylserine/phosphatidylglycerophosphate/cardiolipin synthase-like enzyme
MFALSQGGARLHSLSRLVDHLDDRVGEAVDEVVQARHARRLRRAGAAHALDPPAAGGLWVEGSPPPRPGNSVRVLIDGAQALPRMAQAMQQAHSHIFIAGWCLTPWLQLTRGHDPVVLRSVLRELAARVDVRVLLWAGAPLPVFRPWRPQVRQVRDELCGDSVLHCALDDHERPLHTHHEKLIVIDDEIAFVGGIDLTDFHGDRFDTNDHPLRAGVGWHDVAMELRGPIVADVAEHLRFRWHEVTGERLAPVPAADPVGDATVQLAATIPDRIYRGRPEGAFRVLEAYTRALRSAERLIYLENQFLWSPEIVAILSDKLTHPPSDSFRLVLLLPARPNSGSDDTRGQLGTLLAADANERLVATTLYAHDAALSRPVYVHAKVGIVDDRWLTVGSANLNDHSLFNDTEVNIVTCDEQLTRETRLRLWAEHLESPIERIDIEPARVVDELWRPIANEQARLRRSGLPMTHRLARLPHLSRHSRRLLGPLEGVIVDG